MKSESTVQPIAGKILASYPLRDVYSRTKILALMLWQQCVAGPLLYLYADGDINLFIVFMAGSFALYLVVFLLSRSITRIGDGEIELTAQGLRIPTTAGPLDLRAPLRIDGKRINRRKPSMKLLSEGTTVELPLNYFRDPDHFRQLREHIHIVASGGIPDGTAAMSKF